MRERFKLSVSVFCFLKNEDEILMIKRGNTGWMDGSYSIPAGAIDGNEDIENAVCREVLEEAGVKIKPLDLRMVHVMHCFTEGNEWIGLFYMTNEWNGEPKLMEPHKHSEMKWVDVEKLPENTIPYVKQAVHNYLKNIAYSLYGWEK